MFGHGKLLFSEKNGEDGVAKLTYAEISHINLSVRKH